MCIRDRCYTYGCRVSYHCADGFELVGRNERYCQADGTWTPKDLPACVRKLLTIHILLVNITQIIAGGTLLNWD